MIALLLVFIFLVLSGIHIYWALGGAWGMAAVIPVRVDQKGVISPGWMASLAVALVLLLFAVVSFMHSSITTIPLTPFFNFVKAYGLWPIGGIFILRAIGEFNYVGFFKKYKSSVFGRMDTRFYSPLCLLIGVLCWVLAFG